MSRLIISFVVCIVLASCDVKKNKDAIPDYTIRIYNNNNSDAFQKPKDVASFPDGSILVLSTTPISGSSMQGIHVSKIKKDGTPLGSATADAQIAFACTQILQIAGKYYVVGMEKVSLSAVLLEISNDMKLTVAGTIPNIQYPVATGLDTDNQIIILSYNRDDKETVVSKINTSGSETARKSFPIGFGDNDVEVPILRHFSRENEKLPFLCGTLGGGRFYFNGFYNYHFSMVYFSFNSPNNVKPGYLLGFETDRVVNAFLPIGNGKYALAKSDFQHFEFLPYQTLNTADNQFSANQNLIGFKMPELQGNTGIKIKRISIKGKDVVLYITDNLHKQIVLYFYDANTGVLINTRYLGNSNPFEAGGVMVTPDNGLAIIGTCYVGGRFGKICLLSLSEKQLTL